MCQVPIFMYCVYVHQVTIYRRIYTGDNWIIARKKEPRITSPEIMELFCLMGIYMVIYIYPGLPGRKVLQVFKSNF